MTEYDYEQFLIKNSERTKILSAYEGFVKEQLDNYPDTPAAQMHDWLKEHHSEFPTVNPRTVFNFVSYVRQKYNIPQIPELREYFPVEQLPYGQQAQVDFGQYNMRTVQGKRKKVYFFCMVLSRSRMKFVWFNDRPFTTEAACHAHEKAFHFYGGEMEEIVYDQDRVFVVDENLGDIILTSRFKKYVKARNFKQHFCRKADPESKGKVENVVQYVKKNFLYNRTYHDIEELNQNVMAWLDRTANALPNHNTKKVPADEFKVEKPYLLRYIPLPIEPYKKQYTVRKDNTVSYKSNFYTLPQGTYKGSDTVVYLQEKNGKVKFFNLDNQLMATHPLSREEGKLNANSNHKRDTSLKITQLMDQLSKEFNDSGKAMEYMELIRQDKPRYIRDQLAFIAQTIQKHKYKSIADKALSFCLDNKLYRGTEFREIMEGMALKQETPVKVDTVKPLGKRLNEKANETPEKRNLDFYQNIINY